MINVEAFPCTEGLYFVSCVMLRLVELYMLEAKTSI